MRIDPLHDIGRRLLDVEKPARYLGGEYGSRVKKGEGLFSVAICFPDLYEIGMSNNAIRILYEGLNRLPGVRCERVFAPGIDFERLLDELGLPLYTLETGISLNEVDILGFSVGYELAATNMLSVLKSGRIPLSASERGEGDPVVIAGGPAISNPHPYADFLDAAFIGEAEQGFFDLVGELSILKLSGARRTDMLDRLAKEPAIWMPSCKGRDGKSAVRAIFSGFPDEVYRTATPLPTVKIVQDHGTVEIMRGCPNGCRFCHAGFFYRPQRAKSFSVIGAEVEHLVREGGHREITLASLSSGDYPCLPQLLAWLSARWSPQRVSFQLPSLKVNSFTLPLIAQLAEVRKSGLTFAVETPMEAWQRLINKDVSFDRSVAILEEARSKGFKQAKFYFMIGLPLPGRATAEAEAIVSFFDRLFARIRMQINVNVGTFVPKPHTPFQWSAQISEAESLEAITNLKTNLRKYRNIKLSYHSPFVSQLEGVIARGDERVGALIRAAFEKGARFDAWDEHFDRELWRSVFDAAGWAVVDECCKEREVHETLAWDDVHIRVSKKVLEEEYHKAKNAIPTDACVEKCTHPCGSCSTEGGIVLNNEHIDDGLLLEKPRAPNLPAGKIVFSYRKTGSAAYYQHLTIVDSFTRAFLMSSIPVVFSEGFNPLPRFETVQPLPISVVSEGEIAALVLTERLDTDVFVEMVNQRLPSGISITEARWYPFELGVKQRTIGSLSWGSSYRIFSECASLHELEIGLRKSCDRIGLNQDSIGFDGNDSLSIVLPDPKTKEEGLIRMLESCTETRPIQSVFSIVRTKCFARGANGPVSFFEAYSCRSKKETEV